MVHMILVFCLSQSPAMCVRQRPLFTHPLSLMSCMVVAQQTASGFLRDHPGYRLSRWRCSDAPERQGA